MTRNEDKLIYEMSGKGADYLPPVKDAGTLFDEEFLRKTPLNLPEVSEAGAVRHYCALSCMNYGVDSGFYPLGSCTMKYNPKIAEYAARLSGFAGLHPYQAEEDIQGALELYYNMERYLSIICGMDAFSLLPAAGAHGELTGLMMISEFLKRSGQNERTEMLIPDSAHGTNPASAAIAGFDVIAVPSDSDGLVDTEALKKLAGNKTAGLMLTNPNTLGLFERDILEISEIIHKAGGLLYYDGANLNAVMGKTTPALMGFDVVHLNLHKTFAAPHGGGGPGSGPVGAVGELAKLLPGPRVIKDGETYRLSQEDSIGKVRSFYGNFLVIVKAYAYILSQSFEGLDSVSTAAVLKANYLQNILKTEYDLPYDRICMHEFVLSAAKQKENGVSAMDIAKALIDEGFHPPTVYFPLIVKEALMIEPTETADIGELDRFIEAMLKIAKMAKESPEDFRSFPKSTYICRPDETAAARNPILRV